jgi:hypothetical protein
LQLPRGPETLAAFCRSRGINEVYASFSGDRDASTPSGGVSEEDRVADLIAVLHRSNLRVEALLSSADADMPGKHREKLLDDVRAVVQFNQKRPRDRFDGIHLDVEPQERPENKGAGNLQFLPALVETYRAVRALAEPAQMTVNADIPSRFLKGRLDERRMLLSTLTRLTLMLYGLGSPNKQETTRGKTEKLLKASLDFHAPPLNPKFGQKVAEMAYSSLSH